MGGKENVHVKSLNGALPRIDAYFIRIEDCIRR